MLSIINAADAQFRHESEMRMREHAVLASIRERRAALSAAITTSAQSQATTFAPAARVTRAVWPRPIGVKSRETTVCAVA